MRFGMRCPTCGTENAPDSRFCGGCGARLEPARVAPTVKLPDDTPIATPHHVAPVRIPTPVPASIPPLDAVGHVPTPPPGSMSLGSIPPRAGSIPPQNAQPAIPSTVNRRPGTPPPVAVSSPSLSMPAAAPRRSGALIAVVVIADLGLAAAGAFMLMKGLQKPAAKPAQKTEARGAPPAPVAVAPAMAPATVAAAPAAAATVDPPPRPEPVAARPKETKQHPKKTTAPEDPYGAAPDLSKEVERAAQGSVGSFRSCLQTAIQTQPIHGDVRIAFLIQPDGHVDHAQAVGNTTGSAQLATCLSATIATWTFAPHPGPAASYERPFNYP
jgi:hypothetical protein